MARKIDHSMQDKPIALGKMPPKPALRKKTTNTTLITQNDNKNPNGVISADSDAKPIFIGEYFNVHTRQYHPATRKFVEVLCDKLKDWADTEDAFNLYDFTDAQGFNPDTFYDWCKKFPALEEVHQYALRRLGSKREYGAATRKYAESTIHKTLGHYSHVWKKEIEALAKLKDEHNQNETKIVVIERFPELPGRTPEQVAAAVTKATRDIREYGPQAAWKIKGDEDELS